MLHGTPKKILRPNKSVSRVLKTQLSKINWIIKSISLGLVALRLYLLKKYDTKWPKFPPCRDWPIWTQPLLLPLFSTLHKLNNGTFTILVIFDEEKPWKSGQNDHLGEITVKNSWQIAIWLFLPFQKDIKGSKFSHTVLDRFHSFLSCIQGKG